MVTLPFKDCHGLYAKVGLGNFKYGAPMIGELVEWPRAEMPQEIWTDCGMEFIPYMAQSFDAAKYPLLAQLHPANKLPADNEHVILKRKKKREKARRSEP